MTLWSTQTYSPRLTPPASLSPPQNDAAAPVPPISPTSFDSPHPFRAESPHTATPLGGHIMPSPQLQTIIQMIRAQPDLTDAPFDQQRAAFEAVAAMFPVPDDVESEPVDADGVPAEWISAPGADPDRVIYYLHGGGYVLGSINTHREMISRISRASGARALAIDYRLAPEHPFPAAIEDATNAYRWLLSTGVDPARLVIAGDSAGGGLTMASLVALRDAGVPLPAAAVCLSPGVDAAFAGESMTTKADEDPMITREFLLMVREAFLGDRDPLSPQVSPLYADLTGLPPLLIQVGTAEVLLDDSTRLAERAKSAGVDVTLEPWEDMIHVWQFMAAMLPEGQQAIERIAEFIGDHIGARAAA
nr:esterase MY09-1 [uncultured bacterium]